jgi:hypothetical protein
MLKAEALEEVVDTLKRQMEMVPFFSESGGGQKPEGASLTNCCCESFMGDLDNTLKVSGATTTVRTISNKHIIKTNGYLESEEFLALSRNKKGVCGNLEKTAPRPRRWKSYTPTMNRWFKR